MLKCVTALFVALTVGWALLGSATEASAGHRRHGCASCGPIPPSYHYKMRTIHKHITRYRDVQRTRYVKRIHPIIHVTRIQPIVHVHKVTRVHTRILGVPYPVHHYVTQVLPTHTLVRGSVVYLRPQCGCGY